jgi:hypothetical protein
MGTCSCEHSLIFILSETNPKRSIASCPVRADRTHSPDGGGRFRFNGTRSSNGPAFAVCSINGKDHVFRLDPLKKQAAE